MDEYITRAEHEEFVRRMEAEDHRSSKRLDVVEDNVSQIRDIATSVEKLATNMEHMCKEQEIIRFFVAGLIKSQKSKWN